MKNETQVNEWIGLITALRTKLTNELKQLERVEEVYRSDANFVLVKVADAAAVYKFLLDEKIVVRDRSNVTLCEGCLRITIGTPDENKQLIEALKKFEVSVLSAPLSKGNYK